jgi:hypothetical protein
MLFKQVGTPCSAYHNLNIVKTLINEEGAQSHFTDCLPVSLEYLMSTTNSVTWKQHPSGSVLASVLANSKSCRNGFGLISAPPHYDCDVWSLDQFRQVAASSL